MTNEHNNVARSMAQSINTIRGQLAQLEADLAWWMETTSATCRCGRKAFLDASRHSKQETVPHCPSCELPCTQCECDDKDSSPVVDVVQHGDVDVAPLPSGVDEPKQTEQTVVAPVEMRQINRADAIKEKLTYMTATGRCMKVTKSSKVPNGANLSLGGATLGVFVSDPPKVKKVRGKKGTPVQPVSTKAPREVRPVAQSSAAQQTVASPVDRAPLVASDYLTVGNETTNLVNPQQLAAAKAIFASCVIPGSVGLQRIRTLQKAVGITLPRSFGMTIDGMSKTVSIIGNPDAPNSVNVSR